MQVQVFDLHGRQLRMVRRFTAGRAGVALKLFGRLLCVWF